MDVTERQDMEVTGGRDWATSPADAYRDVVFSSQSARVFEQGNILPPGMTVGSMVGRLLHRFSKVESDFGQESDELLQDFYSLIREGTVLLGTPLITNITHGSERPLASCAAVPGVGGVAQLRQSAEAYYLQNMGSGFNLTGFRDPVGALRELNDHAHQVDIGGRCERYVGNMAHLDVDHPAVLEFINAKVRHPGLSHFNISLNVTDTFMSALRGRQEWVLANDKVVTAERLWDQLALAAWQCGDPGILSLDRLNRNNPLAAVNPYVTTAPCAEVGLAAGETCVFGYINLAPLLRLGPAEGLVFDFDRLERAAAVLTRILDDAVEESSRSQPTLISRRQHLFARKIGIGLCGYADAIALQGLPYGCDEAVQFLRECLATVNYASKLESMQLAERRGSFHAFALSNFARDVAWAERFIQHETRIGADLWKDLAAGIRAAGIRNSMTTALPPSGRVSLLLGVSSSIEPFLSLGAGPDRPISLRLLDSWSVRPAARPLLKDGHETNRILRDAYGTSIDEHLRTSAAAAALVDDGVSKTLNLREEASPDEVRAIFDGAWDSGLKAVSVYRRGSHETEQQGGDA